MAEIEYIPETVSGSTSQPAISNETPPAIADLLRHQQAMPAPQQQASVVTLLTGAYAAAQAVPEVIRNLTSAQERFGPNAAGDLLSNRSATFAGIGQRNPADPPKP